MRKLILTIFAGVLVAGLSAQNATAEKNRDLRKLMAAPVSTQSFFISPFVDYGAPLNTEGFLATMMKTSSSRAAGTIVGNTTYGLGTNASPADRLYVYPSGKIAVVYTGSEETAAAYSDRGTYYNSYDGGAWGAITNAREESYRTGFPQLTNIGGEAGTEMFVCHNGVNQLGLFSAPALTGSFTEMGSSLSLTGTWPRIASSGNNVYILSADYPAAGSDVRLLYHRSTDAGATFDIQNAYLPGVEDTTLYGVMGAESYKIVASGNNVWVVSGESVNDLAMWKSTDNGSSWTRTRIIEFPIPGYNDQISDITGDGIADTITTQDGAVSILIDNSGMAHVFAGATLILDDTPGDGGWSYFPGVSGLWYWNESMGADSVQYLDVLVDWDASGDPFDGIGADLPNYGIGMTSQATPTLDPATGNIYLVYAQPVEYTDWIGDPADPAAQSFRDLFGIYTTDGGFSWSSPVNLTYCANEHYENVYPTTSPTTTGDLVNVLWMQDQEPGNAFETPADPIDNNDIMFRGFDFDRFNPYAPTVDFSYVVSDALVTYTNLSVDADTYEWAFGDGGSATTKNTNHVYAATGSYNVCLTATNVYDSKTTCKTVTIADIAVVDQSLEQSIHIYPSPASSYVNLTVAGNYGTLNAEVYNSIGERVIAPATLSSNTIRFDVNNLSTGNYIVKVIGEDGRYATSQFTVSK